MAARKTGATKGGARRAGARKTGAEGAGARKASARKAASGAPKGLEGRKAPAFTLQDADGERVSLQDLLGRELVLYFYPKDDTPGCTKEACGFRDLWREIRKAGAEVVGISPDGPEAHRRFAEKHELPFRLLCDPEKKAMAKYGAYGEKTMYGRKTHGVIRSSVWIGPDGRVRRHWTRVAKAAEHPERVLAALRGEG